MMNIRLGMQMIADGIADLDPTDKTAVRVEGLAAIGTIVHIIGDLHGNPDEWLAEVLDFVNNYMDYNRGGRNE
jgi:hypothetical protein